MLSVQQLHVKGRRDDLLPPTSLQARRGELVLVAGARQDQRTALALTAQRTDETVVRRTPLGRARRRPSTFGWPAPWWTPPGSTNPSST